MGETTPVPSNWQVQKEKWYFLEGSAWYTRAVDIADPDDGKRRFLRIGAAQYDCKIFLNGAFLGNHYGGSTPFNVELTQALRPGTNWLMACVNNTRTLDRVAVETDGPAAGPVKVTIPELGAVLSLMPGLEGRAESEITVTPELWSPQTPRLDDVHARYGSDQIADRIGFRQIERRGTEILLNGEPLFLRGISVHEDDAKLGKVTNEADLKRRFQHALALDCNFLRLAHYPHHERAAEMADEMGLLWEEIPVYWAIDFANPATYRDAHNQLMELITRDRNRASVIIWSVGNENPDTGARLEFMRNLKDAAKAANPTRLTSTACLLNHSKLKIEDRLTNHIDIIGLNEYYGWYEESFDELITLGINSKPDRPVLVSETGADGVIGQDGPKTGLFSETYMAEVYRKQIDTLRNLITSRACHPGFSTTFASSGGRTCSNRATTTRA